MDEKTQDDLKEFFKLCFSRLEAGEKKGSERYKELDLVKEISEELADVANYAFLQYLKVIRLREKIDRLQSPS